MTKNKFKAFCKKQGLTCKYSGNTRTMYVSGAKASKLMRHSIEAVTCAFKVSTK